MYTTLSIIEGYIMERKLASIRTIDAIEPIPGADLIEAAVVGGWRVVVKRNEFRAGDSAVYIELDSFLPAGNPAWQFLVDKSSREYDGQRGHVLRTAKLRGVYSQGLLLPLLPTCQNIESELVVGLDVTAPLGIVKYEPPVSAQLSGIARGAFPTTVPKTDLERVQNFTASQMLELKSSCYEVTEKIEGSSVTFAIIDSEFVVCSRNLSLVETADNTYWKVARQLNIEAVLRGCGKQIALQGELYGERIQGNIYKVKGHHFACFDIVDLNTREYLSPTDRRALCSELGIPHVPVIADSLAIAGLSVDGIVQLADGESVIGCRPAREGLSFKQVHGQKRFKAISNRYLARNKD